MRKRYVYFNWCYCSIEILGVLAMLKWGDETEFKGSYLDFASSEIGLITLFANNFELRLLLV